MDQSLQGVSFPGAAAAKAELLQDRDVAAPYSVCYPYLCKPKGIALPWMGFGVGDGKEAVILQDTMMKRKRDDTSIAGSVGSQGCKSAPKDCKKFENDFLRHDGHFHSELSRQKGPVCTFVKQYQLKWRKSMSDDAEQPLNEKQSLEYAGAAGMLTDGESKNRPLPTCGVDCYQVRAEIFQKVKGLMAHEPEKLHIKDRIRPDDPEMLGPLPPLQLEQAMYTVDAVCTVQSASTSGKQHEELLLTTQHAAGVSTTEHQAVQTVFTENKKVQTTSNEPKQVQWAILPKDYVSPKVGKLANEIQKQPDEDSSLLKVPSKPTGEIHAQDSLLHGGAALTAWEKKQSPGEVKKTRGKHHILLYQEAMEIAKEQKDLERAREQRQDFWSVYERELKRGKVLNAEEVGTERKGKSTAEDTESEIESPDEDVSASVKINLNAFQDEHPTLTSSSPVSSSPQDGNGSSVEAAATVEHLLDKVGNFKVEPSLNEEVLVGLQGLRKIDAGDSLQSIEAMEQQLNPETSQPAAHLSPTELDCMKAAILSHNFYPRLVTSFINQHKAGAPPDQVERLEKIRSQVMESWRPAGIPVEPAHEEKIKKYQEILTKFERELEKPFQDAMDFSWQMENYLDTIPPSRGRSEGGGSSGSTNLEDFDDEHNNKRRFKSIIKTSSRVQ